MFSFLISYVKGIYLQQIDSKAPNYLTEQYQGIIPYLKEDRLKEGTCTVRLEFSPYHQEQPGLRIYYAYKKSVSFLCSVNMCHLTTKIIHLIYDCFLSLSMNF